jgi:PPK2 family polyphosphate:nucleotide phosphotransferase
LGAIGIRCREAISFKPRETRYVRPNAMKLAKVLKNCRIDKPGHFRLADCDPADTLGLSFDKDSAKPLLEEGMARLSDLQQKLYADDRWAVLIILQGMDTAGKDSAIKHVMSGINPQGCDVHRFSAPNEEELDHDFLWRATLRLPQRGRIGIFNRSYYEEVLVVRVHSELLARERLPHVGKHVWQHRFEDICAFERYLTRNGIIVLKFFLHISKGEQRRRLLARLEEPSKRWKFSMNDVIERQRWKDYMDVYEEMIRATSIREARWHVVPSDDKWGSRVVIAAAIVDALEGLDLAFPKVEGRALAELKKVERALLAEGK